MSTCSHPRARASYVWQYTQTSAHDPCSNLYGQCPLFCEVQRDLFCKCRNDGERGQLRDRCVLIQGGKATSVLVVQLNSSQASCSMCF